MATLSASRISTSLRVQGSRFKFQTGPFRTPSGPPSVGLHGSRGSRPPRTIRLIRPQAITPNSESITPPVVEHGKRVVVRSNRGGRDVPALALNHPPDEHAAPSRLFAIPA